MRKIAKAQVKTLFLPVNDIWEVLSGILRYDMDDSFMLHFVPGDILIDREFRSREGIVSSSLFVYRGGNRLKTTDLLGPGRRSVDEIKTIFGYQGFMDYYPRLKALCDHMETIGYRTHRLTLGIIGNVAEVSAHISFPRTGDFELTYRIQDVYDLGALTAKLIDIIPVREY